VHETGGQGGRSKGRSSCVGEKRKKDDLLEKQRLQPFDEGRSYLESGKLHRKGRKKLEKGHAFHRGTSGNGEAHLLAYVSQNGCLQVKQKHIKTKRPLRMKLPAT